MYELYLKCKKLDPNAFQGYQMANLLAIFTKLSKFENVLARDNKYVAKNIFLQIQFEKIESE